MTTAQQLQSISQDTETVTVTPQLIDLLADSMGVHSLLDEVLSRLDREQLTEVVSDIIEEQGMDYPSIQATLIQEALDQVAG